MDTSRETIGRKSLPHGADTALFFAVFCLYVWLVIDPRLIDHSLIIRTFYHPFSFHNGWAFVREHLVRPGGGVEYCTRLASQFFAFGWVGALLVTAAAWCACLFADALGRRAGRPRGKLLRYVPAVIVLQMYGRYAQPLSIVLSLLAALAGFVLYVRFAPRAPMARIATLLLGFVVLYLLGDAGSLLFAVMVAVDELLIGRRRLVASAAFVCAAVMPWAMGMLLGADLKQAYGKSLVWSPGVIPGIWPFALALALFFPTLLVVAALGTARAHAGLAVPEDGVRKRSPSSRGESRRWAFGPGSARRLATAVFFPGLAAAAWFSLDSFTRTVLEIDYHAQNARWAEVLRSAARSPQAANNFRCYRNIMVALYHTGRLGEEMFRYPQRPGTNLLSTPEKHRDMGTSYHESRLFLELGLVNEAERCASDALAVSGDVPEVLEELAIIHLVKGQPETARVFLGDLAKHPFSGRAARDMLRRMETDATLENDPRVSRIRANMLLKDSVAFAASAEDFLLPLLDRNPRNKMAFELCMAGYLIEGRPDKVVAQFPRLKDLSYRRVPRHFQEAWVICSPRSESPPPIPGFGLDHEVLQAAQTFGRILAHASSRQDAANAAREAGLGDSYFFFLTFGRSAR